MTTVRALSELDGQPHANVFPDAEPKTIRLALEAGEQVEPHRHPDRKIVFYVLDGTIELQLGTEVFDLTEGEIARFDGDQEISPAAPVDSTALIVLAQRTAAK